MIAPLRYMGSKRSLAPTIADIISEHHPDATVVDAFAGTCAVGTEVASRHRVFANDIHAFAEIIARTLLVTTVRIPVPSEAWRELKTAFSKNIERLRPAIATRLKEEKAILAAVKSANGWVALKNFSTTELAVKTPRRSRTLPSLADYRAKPQLKPYCLFSAYFGSSYFSVQHAADIDS